MYSADPLQGSTTSILYHYKLNRNPLIDVWWCDEEMYTLGFTSDHVTRAIKWATLMLRCSWSPPAHAVDFLFLNLSIIWPTSFNITLPLRNPVSLISFVILMIHWGRTLEAWRGSLRLLLLVSCYVLGVIKEKKRKKNAENKYPHPPLSIDMRKRLI